MKFLCTLSSSKRSASNTTAVKKVDWSTNHMVEANCYHTVRTPQVSSTMHDENTVDTATTI